MEATLHFNLAAPDDRADFEAAVAGTDYRAALAELDENLRQWCKHGHQWVNPDDALVGVRDRLHALIDQYDLHLYD